MRGTFPPCAVAAANRTDSKAPAIAPMHLRRSIIASTLGVSPAQAISSDEHCAIRLDEGHHALNEHPSIHH